MFVSADIDLEPVDAVAAILVDEDGRYVMQHRDAYPHIFYPDHWGCFGGAVESGACGMGSPLISIRPSITSTFSPGSPMMRLM